MDSHALSLFCFLLLKLLLFSSGQHVGIVYGAPVSTSGVSLIASKTPCSLLR